MGQLASNEPEVEALVRIKLFEALSEAESRYKTLVERLHEIVFQYDDEWHITFLNQAWETFLGYSIRESINKHFLDFVYSDDRASMSDYISSSKVDYKEMRLVHHDGHPVWFELSIQANADGGGVALLHSIDHHKNIESALREARDIAIEAMEEKSNFVANMSHEIRTPLNGIAGGLQLLLTTDINKEQQQYVEMGLESSKLLQNITNDLLDYSKIEAGQLTLEECEITLPTLVKNALLIATPPTDNTLQVICSISDNVPKTIIGDPTRINQILINLLGNAFKFTEKGHVSLDVDIEPVASNTTSSRIVFTVSDTGIGIPRDRQDAIFDSFIQADPSTTRKYGGTGLGLAIVKRFVKLMNGQLSVESDVGTGSQFTVKIPLLPPL
ncbi:MAG TPA: PAS domain S-box protein [Gammaproteobacteria bacterium]|nr:PAS domain S-box protein [Gammaproteobacteria bacterium]